MAVVSLSDPDFLADPYPAIAEHRAAGVVPNVDQGGWWVLDSDTIWQLIRDPKLANDPASADPDAPITKVFKQARLSMFYMDPPDHTRVRGSVKADFAPRSIATLEGSIAATASSVLAELPDHGQIDLAAAYGDVVPMTVMSDFIGVEPERRDEFAKWTITRIAGMFDPKKSTSQDFVDATVALRGYFTDRLNDGHPTGLIGQMVATDDLDEQEKVDLLIIMLGAGIITTADLIGNTLHALLTNPDELAQLRADPGLAATAVDETLRYDSPALSVGRILVEERDFFGHVLPAGTWLRIMTSGVGRDPARYPEPDRYLLNREHREHYAFGGGLHHCLGLHLGKLEAKVALELLLGRYPSIELADVPNAAVRRGIPGFRGFQNVVCNVS